MARRLNMSIVGGRRGNPRGNRDSIPVQVLSLMIAGAEDESGKTSHRSRSGNVPRRSPFCPCIDALPCRIPGRPTPSWVAQKPMRRRRHTHHGERRSRSVRCLTCRSVRHAVRGYGAPQRIRVLSISGRRCGDGSSVLFPTTRASGPHPGNASREVERIVRC